VLVDPMNSPLIITRRLRGNNTTKYSFATIAPPFSVSYAGQHEILCDLAI
jgi:hypothetical protein